MIRELAERVEYNQSIFLYDSVAHMPKNTWKISVINNCLGGLYAARAWHLQHSRPKYYSLLDVWNEFNRPRLQRRYARQGIAGIFINKDKLLSVYNKYSCDSMWIAIQPTAARTFMNNFLLLFSASFRTFVHFIVLFHSICYAADDKHDIWILLGAKNVMKKSWAKCINHLAAINVCKYRLIHYKSQVYWTAAYVESTRPGVTVVVY